MKTFVFSIITIIIFQNHSFAQTVNLVNVPADDAFQNTSVVEANNTFAFEIYAKTKKDTGNTFMSPYSISSALAMTYAGAKTETEIQMSKVLHFSLSQKGFHKEFKTLNDSLLALNKKDLELKIANSLWIEKDYVFLKDYLTFINAYYNSGVKKTDFKKQTEKSRLEINKWVELQTNNKIKELIKPNVLSQLTRLVIVNAIYFNGTWDKKFDKKLTQNNDFLAEGENSVSVPFMNVTEQYKYYENDNFQLLDIPYKGKTVSMIILLPKKNTGLPGIEKSLNWNNYVEYTNAMVYKRIKISIPKFNMKSEFELKESLSDMGMPLAFGKEADFSGITGNKDLMIDKVIHKTFIKIDETGTEAAGSTAVVLIEKSGMPQDPIEFTANHPFIFVIKDNTNNCILFIGRVSNPLLK